VILSQFVCDFFAVFDFFDNFLKLEKLAQTAIQSFFVLKIKTVNFRLKLVVFNSYFFTIFIFSCSLLFILKRCTTAVASPTQLGGEG